MAKWLIGLGVLNFIFLLFDSIVNGGTGLNTTELKVAMNATDTTMTVTSTSGYPSADALLIGDEEIKYNGKDSTHFYNLTRGYNSTVAVTHVKANKVYG